MGSDPGIGISLIPGARREGPLHKNTRLGSFIVWHQVIGDGTEAYDNNSFQDTTGLLSNNNQVTSGG